MKKELELKTISYKQGRACFTDGEKDFWLTLSPFIDLDKLEFNNKYQVELKLDSSGKFYVDSIKYLEEEKK